MEKATNTAKVKTSTGFECEVNLDVYEDTEAFDNLITMMDPDASSNEKLVASTRVFKKMIGEEQNKALVKAYPNRSDYLAERNEIFRLFNESKKN